MKDVVKKRYFFLMFAFWINMADAITSLPDDCRIVPCRRSFWSDILIPGQLWSKAPPTAPSLLYNDDIFNRLYWSQGNCVSKAPPTASFLPYNDDIFNRLYRSQGNYGQEHHPQLHSCHTTTTFSISFTDPRATLVKSTTHSSIPAIQWRHFQ